MKTLEERFDKAIEKGDKKDEKEMKNIYRNEISLDKTIPIYDPYKENYEGKAVIKKIYSISHRRNREIVTAAVLFIENKYGVKITDGMEVIRDIYLTT